VLFRSGLLAGTRIPPLAIGHEHEEPRVGMQMRRLGAASINLYAYRELCEEARERDAEEELRLFHVAATRARERLILSGVIQPKPPGATTGMSVVERIASGFEIDREHDSAIAIPGPEATPGLETGFPPAELAVSVNLASTERAAALTAIGRRPHAAPDPGEVPAPLIPPTPPPVPKAPLSYTAIASHPALVKADPDEPAGAPPEADVDAGRDREAAIGRGIAVHAMLEWSQANGWREPPVEMVRGLAGDLGGGIDATEELLAPFRAWTASRLFAERVAPADRTRAEVPLLLRLGGVVLRGSIDLLAEDGAERPLVVDYKTDRLGDTGPAEHAERYATQRDLYALAVAEALRVESVEVAYVFLELPEEPVLSTLGPAEIEAGRGRLEADIRSIHEPARPAAPAAPPARRASAP